MPVILGAPVNFGFVETSSDGGLTQATLSGKFSLQSASLGNTSKEDEYDDNEGEVATVVHSRFGNTAEIEYIVTGTTLATARSNSTIPTGGTILSITACASQPGLVKTNWFVTGEPRVVHTNNGAARVTLSLKAYAGVTAVATAS